jgi:hypothetical protein
MHLLMRDGAHQSLIGLAPRWFQGERPHLADDALQHGIAPEVS